MPLRCLLDSGADVTVFPIELCGIFGVDLKKVIKGEMEGVGGIEVPSYTVSYDMHQMGIIIPGLEVVVKESISFCLCQHTPLLGRNFFKYFEIVFQRGGKAFEIS